MEELRTPERPDWDSYFLMLAESVSSRSTCLRRKVGAVIVRDKRVLSSGYNGAPSDLRHCIELGCLREKFGLPPGEGHELCRGLHAEQNAIIQAAFHGVSLDGATCYSTTSPCAICIKLLINAGIKRVVVLSLYPDQVSNILANESGIEIELFKPRKYNGTP